MLPTNSSLRVLKLYLSDTKLGDTGLSSILTLLEKTVPYLEEISLDVKRTMLTSKSAETLTKLVQSLPKVQRVHMFVGGNGILEKHREGMKRDIRAKPGVLSVAVKM